MRRARMMRCIQRLAWLVVIGWACGALPFAAAQELPRSEPEWRYLLKKRLPAYGQRNWIVIADAGFPALNKSGVETVATGADHAEVLKAVLEAAAKAKHVRPVFHLDAELPHVADADAPGIDGHREQLNRMLAGRKPQSWPHDRLLERLDKAGEKFHILVLKTNLTLPYSSVYLEFDSGYWSPELEKRLRDAMNDPEKKP